MEENSRINKDTYYMNIAADIYVRSTCLRRKFGAVIVKNDEIISTGYNGAPRKTKSSIDYGWCWRKRHNIPHGQQYEMCRSVHAEMNAIIQAPRKEMIGSTLYLAGENADGGHCDAFPCVICVKLIINAGIERVVIRKAEGSIEVNNPQTGWKDDEYLMVGKYR